MKSRIKSFALKQVKHEPLLKRKGLHMHNIVLIGSELDEEISF